MTEKSWAMFLGYADGMEPEECERLLSEAGIYRKWTRHATEEEARAAALEALRKLKETSDSSWTACFYRPEADARDYTRRAAPTCISSSDLED